MTLAEVMKDLESHGSEQTRKIYKRHGAPDSMFGVKIEHLKKLQKKLRGEHELGLELYATGNSDAMYLAGLIVDEERMTKTQLRRWARQASWNMISEYTVAWVASSNRHGLDLAREWIESKQEHIASSGWSTYAAICSFQPDDQLPLDEYRSLLNRIKKSIHDQPNRVRYTMNGFVIACGCYITTLTKQALQVAEAVGKVRVDMGETSCKVPDVKDMIGKVEKRGALGKKRKSVMC